MNVWDHTKWSYYRGGLNIEVVLMRGSTVHVTSLIFTEVILLICKQIDFIIHISILHHDWIITYI